MDHIWTIRGSRKDVDLEVATCIVHALMIAVGDSLLPPYLNTYLRVETAESPGERVLEGMLDIIFQGIGIG
jgi:hypothetical protein